jgi:hypothetical protein
VKISVREAWREIKYWIADNLFEYELDEATQWLSFRVEINLDRVKMTKTEKSGYQKAIEVMRDERKEIKLRTGASVDVNRFMD